MSLRKLYAPALLFSMTLLFAPAALAQGDARAQAAAEIESLRAQLKAKEAVLLAPSKADRKAHADFLAQPDTGLARLLPREKWDGKLSIRGGGAYYSFHTSSHEYDDTSDIEFGRGKLSVGFHGADFGFIYEVGDAPLEEVTLEHPSVRFLVTFVPPSTRPEVDKLWTEYVSAGLNTGEFVYRRTVPAAVGKTYVLRSVSYGDADTLVAFRIVREDADGSVTLLWRRLKQFPKPELQRNVAAADGQ